MRKLYRHQATALRHTLAHSSWALYMEQRLGKNLVALRTLSFRKAFPALVVGPYSALYSWAKECAAEGIPYRTAFGTTVQKREILLNAAGGVTLLPWQALALAEHSQWEAVIIDESRTIANPQSAVTKAALKLTSHEVRGILSGTPATEGAQEYYTQLRFLGEHWGGLSYWDWLVRYFRQGVAVKGGKWYPTAEGERYIARTVAQYAYQLRRDETTYRLPNELVERPVRLPAKVRGIYDRAEREFVLEHADGSLEMSSWAGQKYAWARRIADGIMEDLSDCHTAKVNELLDVLDSVPGRVIVWAQYVAEVEALQSFLQRTGRTCLPIYGAVAPAMREKRLEMWAESDDGLLIAQPETLKMGADLSATDTMIWFSVPTSLDCWLQACERTRKIGVHAGTRNIVLYTEGTLDEDIYRALETKNADALKMSALIQRAAERKAEPTWWK